MSAVPNHAQQDKKYMLKIPVQKRSKETVASIVESCSRLLVQEPYHAITTDKIAAMAGVSIGSLYQFFANKEAIVAAVIDDLLQKDLTYIEEHLSKLHAPDLDAKVHAFIDIGFTRFQDNRPEFCTGFIIQLTAPECGIASGHGHVQTSHGSQHSAQSPLGL